MSWRIFSDSKTSVFCFFWDSIIGDFLQDSGIGCFGVFVAVYWRFSVRTFSRLISVRILGTMDMGHELYSVYCMYGHIY